MSIHSRWIIHHLLDSPARAPHQMIPPPRLLLMFVMAAGAGPYVAAQTSTETSSLTSDYPYSNFAPSAALTIVVLVCAFFFMGLFALFVRQCSEDTAGAGDSRHSAAARLRPSARGLDQELIDSFPIFHYADVKNVKMGESLECAVCINEFEEDEQLRLLPKCNHVFHPECIDMWLESHSTCPVCRANLVPTQDELGGTQSSDSADAPNYPSQLGELRIQNQNQVSIDVEEGDGSTYPEVSRQRVGKFPRSHSTGHSLGQLGNNCERYTLRLPEEVRKQIMSRKLKRTASFNVVLPGQGKQVDRSDRWVFTMTPPFLSRLVKLGKESVEGNLTALGTPKLILTAVRTPFDCLAAKVDGVEQISSRPCV